MIPNRSRRKLFGQPWLLAVWSSRNISYLVRGMPFASLSRVKLESKRQRFQQHRTHDRDNAPGTRASVHRRGGAALLAAFAQRGGGAPRLVPRSLAGGGLALAGLDAP